MAIKIVVDSSLALKWVISQPYSPEAAALLRRWGSEAAQLIVPGLFLAETANALYQYVRVRTAGIPSLTLAEAQSLLGLLAGLVLVVKEDIQLVQRAQVFAHEVSRAASYDDVYAALAEREDCEFWTADSRYWHATMGRRTWVRCIAERTLQ